VSSLRAKCPHCGTYTAVALGPDYECHACGASFAAGLVRIPRAWGSGGEGMAEAAHLPLPYPETAVIDEPTLGEQTLAVASSLPERPLVLGGCCCAHVGAVEGLASRHDRLGLVWLDAHGDLNTPETSTSGNAWGMPLRMILDAGAVAPSDAALVGARNLDEPERRFIESSDLETGEFAVERALNGVDGVYVAFDADVLRPGTMAVHFAEPGGPALEETEHLLWKVRQLGEVVGVGFTGLAPDEANVEPITRLCAALGL
jgi:arginase